MHVISLVDLVVNTAELHKLVVDHVDVLFASLDAMWSSLAFVPVSFSCFVFILSTGLVRDSTDGDEVSGMLKLMEESHLVPCCFQAWLRDSSFGSSSSPHSAVCDRCLCHFFAVLHGLHVKFLLFVVDDVLGV